jgi:uncharacterized membrane protein
MRKTILERLKSPVVWAATLALVYFVVKEWIGFEIPGWDTFVTLLTAALVAFGIINNPADPGNL